MATVKNLMIVESPAKAKTIEKFLNGKFEVRSCYGHIRDLPKGNDAVDVKNNYTATYIVPDEKKNVVNDLKKLAKKSKEVWLATDEDREGEAIAWHLCEALGLPAKQTKRIVFHEITKPAIEKAIASPRSLDMNLVNAQQARRVLDRLVGFEISPVLWKKVSMRSALSAGRVQSVAVRLIVEREREIISFKSESFFRVSALFSKEGDKEVFKAELGEKFKTEKEAGKFLGQCNGAAFTVTGVQVKPSKRSPSPPFTTSTLQQEASRKLGFSVSRTMMIAQKLYEAGHITYMRTDSVNLSETAIAAAAKETASLYGAKYVQSRQYKTKSASAQEAHEAIRPTYFENQKASSEHDEQRLYELIWKRAIASQMSDAEIEKTVVRIGISKMENEFTATGEVIRFDGFLAAYSESGDEEAEEGQEAVLPPLKTGAPLKLHEMNAVERFSRPLPRYTEASLVKKLEELGIGRPSTYAPIISTIQKRGYVVKEVREGKKRPYVSLKLRDGDITKQIPEEITGAEKNKLFPTDIGGLVNDFLMRHFPDIMDFGFTARIEKEFDEIALGQEKWNRMIDQFYKPFHKTVKETLKTADRVTGERELGIDPATKRTVIVRMGKYGPMVQLKARNEEEKPKYAKLRPGQALDTLILEEALELLKLPRVLGQAEGQDVVASEGRFGPYVQHAGKFYSIKGVHDPLTIKLEEATELIASKKKAAEQKTIRVFEEAPEIKILRGPYGPYIATEKRNVAVPKDRKPEDLTLEDCRELIEKAKSSPPRRRRPGKKQP